MPLKEKQGLITRPCFLRFLTALCIDTGSSSTFTLRCGTILNTIFKSTADALPSTIPLSVKIRMLSGSCENNVGTTVTPSPIPTEHATINKFFVFRSQRYLTF